MGALVLLGIALALGALFGWIAFFHSLNTGNKLIALRQEVSSLKAKLQELGGQGDAQVAPAENETTTKETAPPIIYTPREKPTPDSPASDGDDAFPDEVPSAHEQEPYDELEEIFNRPLNWARTRASRKASDHESGDADADHHEGYDREHHEGAEFRSTLEQSLAGNWLIWLGGAALALGGAFLLKSAIDAGFFGPVMRVAAAIIAGAAMIAAGEWARRTRASDQDPEQSPEQNTDSSEPDNKIDAAWRNSAAPAVLAGAGGSTIYGAIFAAYGIFNLLPSLAAFVLLVAACVGMLVLAVLHRAPAVAALGLVGAYLSPLLTASGDPAANALFLYVFGVSAAGFIVARIMSWRVIAYIALAGGFLWPLTWLIAAGSPAFGLYVYLPAYLALAGMVAWDDAKAPLDVNQLLASGVAALPVSLIAFNLAAIGALGLALLLSLKFGDELTTVAMWTAFGLLTLGGAHRREAFSLSPVFAILAVTLAIIGADPGDVMGQGQFSLFFVLLFGLGGYAAMREQLEKGPLAAVAAFGPVLILTAQYYQETGLDQSMGWALAMFALVFANIAMLAGLRERTGAFDKAPGAVSAFVIGATLASSLSIAIGFDGLMMSAALGVQAPVLAWLWLRYKLPALKYGAVVLAVLSSLRLLLLPEIADYSFGGWPIINMLIPGYLAPAAGFWFAARWFEKGGLARTARVIQGLEAGAIALFAAFASLQIRHLLNDGDIDAGRFSLLEVSLQVINWVSISAFLRWRFGDQLTRIRRFAELGLISLGAVFSFAYLLTSENPYWGGGPDIAGPPVFNLLLIAYLAPALAFGAAAYVTRRSGAIFQARLAGLFGALLGFVWIVLTIRHVFHAPDLSRGTAGLLEVSLQIIAWVMVAAIAQYRFGARGHLGVHIVERALLGLAALMFYGFSLSSLNPWLHANGSMLAGPPGFNLLLVYYLGPALAFGAASYAARLNGYVLQSRVTGLGAAFAGFVWIIMSVRHFFHAPILSVGDIGAGESWAYSIATIIYAVGLLIAGAFRHSAILRFAGLGVLMLAVMKVFLLDTAGLDGVWRASSFLGLGAALVGIAVLYQRLTLMEKARGESG